MNKTAIKNFAVWARNKLIADISYRAGLMGITESGITSALPQSTGTTEFYDIGTAEPYAISGEAVRQRRRLVELIERKAKETDYETAYKYIIEEVAYTWFNRLIAIRFMEVNDYLPSHIRVLSSESGKLEPDLVTTPFDAELVFSKEEEQQIIQLKMDNRLDELFRILFIKQCNSLNEILPVLFETTSDYTELLLNISFVDQDGIVYHLINDIKEEEFDINKDGQVEIIGWMYQYYNIEPKDETFAFLKKNIKITKERIPAATQLFTPDWIVRYMVENSLGRLWLEGHPDNDLKMKWDYYLDDVKQKSEAQIQLEQIYKEYENINPESIKIIDPCMGSGHILVYCFDVLMQIYESQGYSQRDASQLILEKNLYGLDIDKRAMQLAYFAVMMKARQYNRRIFLRSIRPRLYVTEESNSVNRNQLDYFGVGLSPNERNVAKSELCDLLDSLIDAKEYGSILNVKNYNWDLLNHFVKSISEVGQMTFDTIGLVQTQETLITLIEVGRIMAQKYHVVVTNPPYMGSSGMSNKLLSFIKKEYPVSKADLFAVFIEKGINMAQPNGFLSMITMQAWLFLSSYTELRAILSKKQIISLLQIGFNSFPELNSQIAHAVTFCIRNCVNGEYVGKYFNLNTGKTSDDKEQVFFNRIRENQFYINNSSGFEDIPNNNFAYWLSDNEKQAITNSKRLGECIDIRQGLATGNNDKFLRLWHEVNYEDISFDSSSICEFHESGKKYAPYNKGGNFRRWYGNNENIIRFDRLNYNVLATVGNHLPSRDFYFKRGITWSLISTNNFAARLSKGGFVFDVGGSSGFPNDDLVYYYLGLLCSKISYNFLQAFNPTINFQVGDIKSIPAIYAKKNKDEIDAIVKQIIEEEKDDWDSVENSWDFRKHPLIDLGEPNLKNCCKRYIDICNARVLHIKELEENLNSIFIEIYKLNNEIDPEVSDKYITVRECELHILIKSLISYSVGCMFGRYSLDKEGICFSGGNWDRTQYKSFIPDMDNCIPFSDEEYFEDDIVGQFCRWLKVAFGEECLEENLDFIAQVLGSKGSTSREIIRNYFLNDFIKDHIKNYQKRPIYWLFDSGKQNGFKALVYMHRWNSDTIGKLRVDYLHRVQRIYESEINRMQDTIDHSTNAREAATATKRKEKLQKQIKECREYDEKIGHLALSRIDIDLDDGVKVNYEKVQTASDGKKYQVLAKI